MGEVILEKGEVLKVYFVCATAVQSQLFSFADLFPKCVSCLLSLVTIECIGNLPPERRIPWKSSHVEKSVHQFKFTVVEVIS